MDIRTKYTFKKRVKTLSLLRDNNYNFQLTTQKTGISKSTITDWRIKHGFVIYELLDLYKGDCNKVKELDYKRISNNRSLKDNEKKIEDDNFQQLVSQAKLIAVKSLKEKLRNEPDVKKIADSLKLLVEIEKVDDNELMEEGKSLDDYVNFLVKGYTTENIN